MNYFDNYLGRAYSGVVSLADGDATIRLPSNECKFVKLARWNTTDNEVFTSSIDAAPATTDDEIYYGFNGVLFGQIFPSTETDLLPVSNTDQIIIRSPAKNSAGARIYYTYFK
jgi:hypothetical protein